MFKRVSFLFFCVFMSSSAFSEYQRFTHFGARPLAMGNAYVSRADDFNALFYNPAGLAFLEGIHGGLLMGRAETNKNTINLVKEIRNLAEGSSGDLDSTLELINNHTGKAFSLGVAFTPHFIWGGFGLGAGIELSGALIFHRYPSIDIDMGPKAVIPISYAHSFFKDQIAVGLTAKVRAKGGINREFSLQDLEVLSKNEGSDSADEPKLEDYVEGGIAYGADIGFLFRPKTSMKPSLGISLTDIGDSTYKKMTIQSSSTAAPSKHEAALNFGTSLTPVDYGWVSWTVAADVHSANNAFSFSKKLGLGSEIQFWDYIGIQTGFYHGYLSGGLQIDVPLLEIRMMTYAEELGENAGQIQDRRYLAEIKLIL